MSNNNSKYRIQAVAEMTGIPSATLRAWERRYGVPSPMRTDSSYRLYSDADIDVIRRLRELTESGMAPAEAARVVKKQAEVEAPVDAVADPFESAQETILDAVDRFDPTALEVAVRRMMFLGSAPMVFDRVLAPCMYTIGRRWHDGAISVGQEHMASEILGSAARDMLRLFQHDQDAPMVLLACFADEEHALPIYGVAFRFAQWGYHPVILGARTPPAAIRHAVERLQPAVIGLSLTIPPPAHRARELCEEYAAACGSLPWVVGGRGAGELTEIIEECGGVSFGAESVATLRARVEGLIAKARRERSHAAEHATGDVQGL
jgi:MerR family transcriptional regulator, light-induced transcriptional regulator